MIVSTIIAGLAGARLTRAWSFETIGGHVRTPIDRWVGEVPFNDDGSVNVRGVEARDFVDDLVHCPFCIGFWLTLGCVIGLRFKLTRPIVLGLAAAALQSAIVDHYPGFDHGVADED
jgi:hypothetical protein